MGIETNATRVEFNAVDNSLPVLQAHRAGLDRVSEAYDRSAAAALRYSQSESQSGSRAQQMTATERALAQVEQSANRTAIAINSVGTSGAQAMNQYGNAVTNADQKTRTFGDTLNSLKGLVAGALVAFSASGLVSQIDQYTKYNAQLKLATATTTEYANAQNDVRRIAKDSQADLAGTGVLYARISNGTRELGLAQTKVANLTEAVNLGLKVSGSTATETASAQLQLSQAFASGTLRGEEFNAVNEAGPRIMKALADGMGVPVGALKEMATNGKITAEVMANALPKALEGLRQEAKDVQTISGSYQVLKNSVLEFVGVQSQASGAVSLITGGIDLLSNNLGLLAGGMATVLAVKFANYLSEVVTSTYASVTASRALAAANLSTAQAQVAATASTLALADARVIELRQAVLSASGQAALAVTTNGLIPAQARAAAASVAHTEALAAQTVAVGAASTGAGLLRGALAFLGGPVGLLITVLGVAATAWGLFGSKAEEANDKALKSTVETSQETITRLDKEIEKLKERNALREVVPATKGVREVDQEALARAKKDYDEALSGQGKAAGLNDVARLEVVRSLGVAYGSMYQRLQEVTAQTEKLNGATTNDKLKKWLGENGTAAQRMAAAFEEAKKEVGVLTPEMEKLIKAKFADKAATKEAHDIFKELNSFKIVELKKEHSILEEISRESKTARESTKKWMQEQRDNYDAANNAMDAHAQKMLETNELAQLEIDLLGVSAVERNTIIEQKKIQIALEKELAKLREMNLTEDARQTLVDKANSQALIDKSTAQLRAQQGEWTKFAGEIYTGLYDSLYRGFEAGKGFGKSLWDSTQNMFKTNVIKVMVQGIMTSGSGMVSSMARAFGDDSSQSSGGTSSFLTVGKSIYDGFSSGFSGFGNSVANYVQAGLDKAGLSMSEGTTGSFASGSGTAASYGAGMAVGVYGGRAISNGYAVYGSGNGMVNAGTAIGGVIGSIVPVIGTALGMAIGGILGGIANRAFGHKAPEIQQSELSGEFGASGFSGNVRDVYKSKGGWFSSDKWSEQNNAVTDTKSMNDAFASVKESVKGYANILGLSTAEIDTFTKSFKVNLSITGDAAKDTEANSKIMVGVINDLSNDMSNLLSPALKNFAKEGESAAATLVRLSGNLMSVNAVMNSTGMREFSASLEGANASQRLLDLTGGIEKLSAGAQYFFDNFLSDAEKIKPSAALVSSTMDRLGQSSVDTVEEFKILMQGLDLSSQSGAEMYTQLIAIAPQFKLVADYTAELNKELASTGEAAKAAEAALERANNIAKERATLQSEYNNLTMTSAQLMQIQRDAIAESNRDIFDKIQAVKAENEAAKVSAAEAEVAKQIATQQRALDIELMRALGNEEGALAATRADALAAMPAQLRATQEQIWAATAATAAMAKAQASAQAEIQRQEQAQAKWQQERAAQISKLESNLSSAYNRRASELNSLASAMDSFGKSALSAKESLIYGASSTLGTEAKYLRSRDSLGSLESRAMSQDASAISELQQFIELSRAYNASNGVFVNEFDRVQNILDRASKTALSQADYARAQLTALNESVRGLIDIKDVTTDSAQDVVNAIRELTEVTRGNVYAKNASDASKAGLAPTYTTGPTADQIYGGLPGEGDNQQRFMALLEKNRRDTSKVEDYINAQYESGRMTTSWTDQMWSQENYHNVARELGLYADPWRDIGSRLPKFADGGIFTNGIVSQPTNFNMAQMGEDGAEAIVPLAQGPGGLGIRNYGGGKDKETIELLKREIEEAERNNELLEKQNELLAKILESTDQNAGSGDIRSMNQSLLTAVSKMARSIA